VTYKVLLHTYFLSFLPLPHICSFRVPLSAVRFLITINISVPAIQFCLEDGGTGFFRNVVYLPYYKRHTSEESNYQYLYTVHVKKKEIPQLQVLDSSIKHMLCFQLCQRDKLIHALS
jgi:hypothetical protein